MLLLTRIQGRDEIKLNVFYQVEPALMFDSVYALARGLQALERGATLRPVNISCDDENPWTDGSSLFNYINSVSIEAKILPSHSHSDDNGNSVISAPSRPSTSWQLFILLLITIDYSYSLIIELSRYAGMCVILTRLNTARKLDC